jgi:aldose sugar dehydrogenase
MLSHFSCYVVSLIIALLCNAPSSESSQLAAETAVKTRVAATGLSHPWELIWGPDNWIWFTEKQGNIGRLNPETGKVQRLFTINGVWMQGESGLLGMALHPDFPITPHLFVSYTYDDAGSKKERVVRYTYDGATLTDPLILLDGITANTFHDGSRLLIIGDKLYITTGEAGQSSLSQNKSSNNGKILRLNLDGSIPSDNPFGTPVWSFGHRNAQGLVLASNGMLYSSEHGPDRDDEVNIIEKGRNYGWPSVNGFCDQASEQAFCEANNVKEPIAAWTPTLAVSGMTYYDNDLIPQWKNSLLMLTLKERQFMVLKLSEDGRSVVSQETLFDEQFGRLRAICVSPDGRVFFATDVTADRVIEVTPLAAGRKSSAAERTGLDLRTIGRQLHINAPEGIVDGTLEIFDGVGRMVHTVRLVSNEAKLDLGPLASGSYTLILQTKGRSLTGRFYLQ